VGWGEGRYFGHYWLRRRLVVGTLVGTGCTVQYLMSAKGSLTPSARPLRCSQSTYRGRVEIGGVYLHALSSRHLERTPRDGRYSQRGWECTPTLIRRGWFFHRDGFYARRWPLPLCGAAIIATKIPLCTMCKSENGRPSSCVGLLFLRLSLVGKRGL
jgi:hypothetical protein